MSPGTVGLLNALLPPPPNHISSQSKGGRGEEVAPLRQEEQGNGGVEGEVELEDVEKEEALG